MPKINSSSISYLERPCPRCGSKRRISKVWKEEVATFNGTATIQHSQSICTNKACQAEFDKNLREDRKKREDLKLKKEVDDAERKAKRKKKKK